MHDGKKRRWSTLSDAVGGATQIIANHVSDYLCVRVGPLNSTPTPSRRRERESPTTETFTFCYTGVAEVEELCLSFNYETQAGVDSPGGELWRGGGGGGGGGGSGGPRPPARHHPWLKRASRVLEGGRPVSPISACCCWRLTPGNAGRVRPETTQPLRGQPGKCLSAGLTLRALISAVHHARRCTLTRDQWKTTD